MGCGCGATPAIPQAEPQMNLSYPVEQETGDTSNNPKTLEELADLIRTVNCLLNNTNITNIGLNKQIANGWLGTLLSYNHIQKLGSANQHYVNTLFVIRANQTQIESIGCWIVSQ